MPLPILLVLIFAVHYAVGIPENNKYGKFENLDVDSILSNDRLVLSSFKCLMDEGKCTSQANEIKKVLPDAINTKCSGCSEKQKEGANKIVKFLYEKKPEMWSKLEDKYDPDHKYRTLYKEEAEKFGIKV